MLQRKAEKKLESWKRRSCGRALLVTGARQVGKSFLVSAFGEREYKSVVSFDLVDDERALRSFRQAASADDLLMRISLLAESPLIPHETLVFIDEVQEAPEVVTHVKRLLDHKEYDFALSGSLLGVELENVRSFPVGYVTEVGMLPLDFEEFCWAMGAGPNVFDTLRECLESEAPVPDYLHERMTGLFRRYLLVGGMPDAVVVHRESGGIDGVRAVHEDIRTQYRRDITKYAPKERRLVIQDIYDRVPSQLAQQNRRFKLSDIPNVKRFANVADDFLWLTKAGVAHAVYNVAAPVYPLRVNEQRRTVKLFMADTGMLTSTFVKRDTAGILDGKPVGYLGGVYENAAVQELVAHGAHPYYFTKRGIGELDALFERPDGTVVAVEIKSGSSYRTHRAIDNALATEHYGIDEAYVAAEVNIERDGRVLYVPAYLLGMVAEG